MTVPVAPSVPASGRAWADSSGRAPEYRVIVWPVSSKNDEPPVRGWSQHTSHTKTARLADPRHLGLERDDKFRETRKDGWIYPQKRDESHAGSDCGNSPRQPHGGPGRWSVEVSLRGLFPNPRQLAFEIPSRLPAFVRVLRQARGNEPTKGSRTHRLDRSDRNRLILQDRPNEGSPDWCH